MFAQLFPHTASFGEDVHVRLPICNDSSSYGQTLIKNPVKE